MVNNWRGEIYGEIWWNTCRVCHKCHCWFIWVEQYNGILEVLVEQPCIFQKTQKDGRQVFFQEVLTIFRNMLFTFPGFPLFYLGLLYCSSAVTVTLISSKSCLSCGRAGAGRWYSFTIPHNFHHIVSLSFQLLQSKNWSYEYDFIWFPYSVSYEFPLQFPRLWGVLFHRPQHFFNTPSLGPKALVLVLRSRGANQSENDRRCL